MRPMRKLPLMPSVRLPTLPWVLVVRPSVTAERLTRYRPRALTSTASAPALSSALAVPADAACRSTHTRSQLRQAAPQTLLSAASASLRFHSHCRRALTSTATTPSLSSPLTMPADAAWAARFAQTDVYKLPYDQRSPCCCDGSICQRSRSFDVDCPLVWPEIERKKKHCHHFKSAYQGQLIAKAGP